ncbi:hypothetical protein [Brevibacillus brevis]|uniref:hypothetical protein n=1 Tax=Brevibacillus brevis TaxID=1393 RepID=UPI0007D8B7F7|nr:hypothetical protein [Brevibacillus brevis]
MVKIKDLDLIRSNLLVSHEVFAGLDWIFEHQKMIQNLAVMSPKLDDAFQQSLKISELFGGSGIQGFDFESLGFKNTHLISSTFLNNDVYSDLMRNVELFTSIDTKSFVDLTSYPHEAFRSISNYSSAFDAIRNAGIPSFDFLNATLNVELHNLGFYSPDLTTEEKLQKINDKIDSSTDKPEWAKQVLVWFLGMLVNYLILFGMTNYSNTGDLQFPLPSVDTTMFFSLILGKKSTCFRYVRIDNLEVKEIAKNRSKTIATLEKEQEVVVLRRRKDWSFVEFMEDGTVVSGWTLTRYLEK